MLIKALLLTGANKNSIILMAKKKKKTKKQAKKQKPKPKVERTTEGKFPKGVSGNSNGRPKGSGYRYLIKDLVNAIRVVEDEEGEELLVHFVRMAYTDTHVLIALGKKLLPDLKSIEGLLATYDATMTDGVAELIRKKLREQYGSIISTRTKPR